MHADPWEKIIYATALLKWIKLLYKIYYHHNTTTLVVHTKVWHSANLHKVKHIKQKLYTSVYNGDKWLHKI